VAGYSGDAGNALMTTANTYHTSNGMMFTTPDNDNDERAGGVCSGSSGWWFRWCSASNINKRTNGKWATGVARYNVQASRMLVKLY